MVAGRTAEFGLDLDHWILFVPAGTEGSISLVNKLGMSCTSTHAAVGIGDCDSPSILAGFNDAGLSVESQDGHGEQHLGSGHATTFPDTCSDRHRNPWTHGHGRQPGGRESSRR